VVNARNPLIVGSSQHVIDRDTHILGKTLHPDIKGGRSGNGQD